MITKIHLRHFKCFETLDLPLGKLTLLTGHNATGKSSVIQSLLLLHQNIVSMNWGNELTLNGESVSLGSFGDVLDSRSGRKGFTIGVSSDQCRIDWTFETDDRSSLTAPLITVGDPEGWRVSRPERIGLLSAENDTSCPFHDAAFVLGERLGGILHVSTERIGPRETYSADTEAVSRLGARGEYTAWFLHRNGENPVSETLRRPDTPPSLLRQTEAWLAFFFPGAGFQVERIKDTNLVTLRFRTSAADSFHRPGNVGYGLSHILPVLVGGLGVSSGEMLIVENPEAHLHPEAQAEIGFFLAQVAAAGAQVVVESHSDHVLNGIRLAVKRGILASTDTLIHYFNSRDTNPQLVSPTIAPNGALDRWPPGFFDQIEKDLDQLASW